ncbi:MAG: phosphate/phosphite/phosphonate ABC transporter substrate-binding protein [Rhodocyclaceae bacterium]|nr:phosphate/phosphite/phosphonate ABC transporter substrate-binding protein [Rhodocyclaceae bacterium]
MKSWMIRCLALVCAAGIAIGARAETLRVGVVPQFTSARIEGTWQPLLAEVGRRAGVTLELSPSPSIPDFERRFARGEFDLVYLNPYHQVMAHQAQGYRPILRDVGRLLSGILVVRKDSPLTRVEDLAGQVVAFPAPNALGASLMMRAALTNRFGIAFTPRYVKTHTSVYLNVLLGEAAAGGGVRSTFREQKPEVGDGLRILFETEKVPPHPISVHPRVPARVVESLVAAFLDIGGGADASRWLGEVPIGQIGATDQSEYEPLTRMGLEAVYER